MKVPDSGRGLGKVRRSLRKGREGGARAFSFADALSKWVVVKANFDELAGEEGKNKGMQREKE